MGDVVDLVKWRAARARKRSGGGLHDIDALSQAFRQIADSKAAHPAGKKRGQPTDPCPQ